MTQIMYLSIAASGALSYALADTLVPNHVLMHVGNVSLRRQTSSSLVGTQYRMFPGARLFTSAFLRWMFIFILASNSTILQKFSAMLLCVRSSQLASTMRR